MLDFHRSKTNLNNFWAISETYSEKVTKIKAENLSHINLFSYKSPIQSNGNLVNYSLLILQIILRYDMTLRIPKG